MEHKSLFSAIKSMLEAREGLRNAAKELSAQPNERPSAPASAPGEVSENNPVRSEVPVSGTAETGSEPPEPAQ